MAAGPAFLDGYHAGLAMTIALVAVGAIISYVALRRLPAAVPSQVPVQVPGQVPDPAADPAPGQAAGPELADTRS